MNADHRSGMQYAANLRVYPHNSGSLRQGQAARKEDVVKRLLLPVLVFALLVFPLASGAAIYELNWVDTASAYHGTTPSGPYGWLDFNFYGDRATYAVTLNPAAFGEPALGHAIDGFYFNAPAGFDFSDHVADPLWWSDNWYQNSGATSFGDFTVGLGHIGGGIYGDTFNLELIGLAPSMETDLLRLVLGPDSPDGGNFFAVHVRTQPLVNSGLFTNAPEQPIPEPGTLILLGSGLAGLAGYRRNRIK